jgi:hypothetical protein
MGRFWSWETAKNWLNWHIMRYGPLKKCSWLCVSLSLLPIGNSLSRKNFSSSLAWDEHVRWFRFRNLCTYVIYCIY